MSLPPGVSIVAAQKITVTERGWFAPPFTACRFAVEAQILARMGYMLPLSRAKPAPGTPDDFVRDLQLAGDNTPKTGSTLAQGQKAIAVLLPDAPVFFGTMTDAQMLTAIGKGATVGFAVNCGKLPRYLKNYVGFGYNGGHYMAVDGAYPDGTVDLSDPMFSPARLAKPRRVPWKDVGPAVVRNGAGAMIVTLGYQDAAYLRVQLAAAQARVAELAAQIAALA